MVEKAGEWLRRRATGCEGGEHGVMLPERRIARTTHRCAVDQLGTLDGKIR